MEQRPPLGVARQMLAGLLLPQPLDVIVMHGSVGLADAGWAERCNAALATGRTACVAGFHSVLNEPLMGMPLMALECECVDEVCCVFGRVCLHYPEPIE